MADDGRYYGETDPEWAISQLAAQVAGIHVRPRRRARWQMIGGVVVTTALVAVAFLFGLVHEIGVPATTALSPDTESAPQTTLAPRPPAAVVAPQVTLRTAPKPSREATPGSPRPEQVAAPTTPPDVVSAQKPGSPSNQVGPNKPIKKPIDPDDR